MNTLTLDSIQSYFQHPVVQAALLAGFLGLLLGWLIARLRAQKVINELSVENARLETEVDGEARHHHEQLEQLKSAREAFSEHFAALSQAALRQNSSQFLSLAEQNLKHHQTQAQSELQQRQQAIDNLVKPIREALSKTEQQIINIEKERKAAYSALSQQLETMAQNEIGLRQETQNLINALKRPDVRGRWGEMSLKRLAELAGMIEFCDFSEQAHTATEDGSLRPDMIVRMPDHRELIIDAKTPLDGYIAAMDAENEDAKLTALKRHSKNVRERVRTLAGKNYWAQFKHSPDFVVLFVPGDQFLSGALEQDPQLLEDALGQKVVLATPSTLIALLRAVAFGWKQSVFSENAEKIRDLGEDLYKRIATLTEHFFKLGKSLNSSVENYNKTLGSLERQLLPGARKMAELGIQTKKETADLNPVEQSARPPSISDNSD